MGLERRGVARTSVKLPPQRRRRIDAVGFLALFLVAAGCSQPSDEASPLDEGSPPNATSPSDEDVADAPRKLDTVNVLIADPPMTAPLCELAGPPRTSADDPDVLVFAEEFDGDHLDPLRWNVASGFKGHGGISNTTALANAVPRDGMLEVTTDRNPSSQEHPYVSGYVDTLGKHARTYGRITFRARFGYAAGVWYAIWGRPWTKPFPEIDIELVNRPTEKVTQVYFVNHWAAPPLPADDRRSYVMFKQDVSEMHDYELLWKPGSLSWYIDGVHKMDAKPQGVPDEPVYWTINAWVGGWAGQPNDTTPFPNTFAVDHLRVYRVGGLVADPQIMVPPRASGTWARREAMRVSIANFDEACAHVQMWDGDTLVKTKSRPPFHFPLASLARGHHRLSFKATDGVRTVTTVVNAKVD